MTLYIKFPPHLFTLNVYERGEMIRLTGNERTVLKILLNNSRASDVYTADKLRISSQAVRKIRGKLKRIGMIKNYVTNVDHSSLNINIFSLAMLEIASMDNKERDAIKRVLDKNLSSFYKVCKNDVTHIGLFGFRNINELDEFFQSLHYNFSESINVKNNYIFSRKGLLKQDQRDLFLNVVKEYKKEKMPVPSNYNRFEEDEFNNKNRKLSTSEKEVLKLIIKNSRVSSEKLKQNLSASKITTRGIAKIRDRLENKGIVRDHSLMLSYEKLGIDVLAFIFLNKSNEFSKFNGLNCWANKSPNIIEAYRLNEGSSYALLCGFRNLRELENYCSKIESQESKIFSVNKTYIVSPDGLLRSSPHDFLMEVLN